MRERPEEPRKEWKDKYNSFNSDKGLTYFESHYKPIAEWWEGNNNLPAPIELSLDPAHVCNYQCGHCNAQRYLVINPDEVPTDRKIMTKEHLRNLIDFMSDWGVRGVCLGGGGEPLMNKNVWELPSYIAKKGMKSSYATNGSLINEKIAEEMMNCRWVGVSLDSGTKEVFKKVHNIDMFDKVIKNLELIIRKKEETKSKIDIAYKFLIRPDNWQDIYTACKLAKEIGVRDFHARPADLERKDYKSVIKLNYDLDEIHDLFRKCHDLEKNDKFRVFTIMHKFDPEFKVKHGFSRCCSSPLMIQVCSNGGVYVCADHRLEERFKLCDHYPHIDKISELWGSEKHRDILKSINVNKECGRCTYGVYAIQCEKLAIENDEPDPMCLDFP
ncbi:MAG TPA: radical SAM protein [Candidatus Paceibacterota bacterium]|nr:radical SAM protein [Candidatus Paceibacterota bacterium]